MNEWKKVKLKDITISITDGKHGDCKGQDNSGYYFISCKDVSDGTIHYENARQITKEDFIETDKRTNLATNDILITNSGTIGRMAFVKDIPETRKTTFQKSVAIVKPNTDKVLPIYLYYLLQSKVSEFVNSSNGAAQKNLLLSTMREFELSIEESFSIQQRIATILSRYDSLIENYQKQIRLLEESAQRLYKEWFIDLRFPGHENTKIVDGVPEGWKKKKIFELGKVITGKTPSTANKANYGGDIPFITIPDMHSGIYPISSQTLSKQGADSQLGKYVPENSLLVSCIGTAGLVCISEALCQTNQQINSLVMENGLKLYYMYFTFLSLKEHLNNIGSNGATMTNVNKSKFENIEVVVPIDSLLDSFNIIANNTFVKIKNLSLQIRHLIEARDRLLPKLMSGKVIVNR